jgi:hypothetical protein
MEFNRDWHLNHITSLKSMKSSFSIIIPKPGIAKWGNFNHTTLVKAELFRAKINDKTAAKTIEGIVRSSQDLSALEGISVSLKGTNLEAQTDVNGWFFMIIEKPSANDILVFTSSGFDTLHVTADEDFLHVNLKLVEQKTGSKKKRWAVRNFFSF